MGLRQFRLLVAGTVTDEAVDRLFDRAEDLCVEVLQPSGSTPGGRAPHGGPPDGGGRVAWVAFDRVAPTLVDAVVSGVRDLDVAGLGIEAAIGDDSLVTVETIAERLGRGPEVVRGWDLPQPVVAHPRRPVYDWPEIAEWAARRLGPAGRDDLGPAPWDDGVTVEAATLEAVTLILRVRALAPRLERMTPLRSLL